MRAARKTLEEQYRLILECRKSGLADCDWCRKNGINPKTFRNWIGRFRNREEYPIPDPSKKSLSAGRTAQGIVKVDILPKEALCSPAENAGAFQPSPSIEIAAGSVTFRFSGAVDASLYEKTLLMLGGLL